jgi:guanylate kinase
MVADDAFLEWAEVYGNLYGSPRAPIMAPWPGPERAVRHRLPGLAEHLRLRPADTVRVYILPPSLAEMSRRLHARSQDSEEVIDKRLGRAKGEVAHCGRSSTT